MYNFNMEKANEMKNDFFFFLVHFYLKKNILPCFYKISKLISLGLKI